MEKGLTLVTDSLDAPTFFRLSDGGNSYVDQIWSNLGNDYFYDTKVVLDDDLSLPDQRLVYTRVIGQAQQRQHPPAGLHTGIRLSRFKEYSYQLLFQMELERKAVIAEDQVAMMQLTRETSQSYVDQLESLIRRILEESAEAALGIKHNTWKNALPRNPAFIKKARKE